MDILKSLKDVVAFLQKTDNIDMVNKVINVQSQIIDMQEKNMCLKKELDTLKDIKKLEKNIVRHESDNVIHLKNDNKILYCSKCWDDERKLIQVAKTDTKYCCPKCNDIKFFLGKEPINYDSNNGEKITII